MAVCHEDHEVRGGDGDRLEIGIGWPGAEDGGVDGAVADGIDLAREAHLLHDHLDLRVGRRKPLEQAVCQAWPTVEEAERKATGGAARLLAGRGDRVVAGGDGTAGMLDEGLSGRGEIDPVRVASKE